jgi:hypothetical protein
MGMGGKWVVDGGWWMVDGGWWMVDGEMYALGGVGGFDLNSLLDSTGECRKSVSLFGERVWELMNAI